MSIIGTVYEDVTTEVLGDIGSWQWLMTFVTTLLMVPNFFSHHKDMFLLKETGGAICLPHDTYDVINVTLCSFTTKTNSTNTTEVPCHKWQVKLMWMVWFKKSWLVFCDDKMKMLSTAMICRLGQMFGCVIYGLIADSFGRRRAIIMNVIADITLRLVITFCDSEGWFRLFVFLRSLFGSASLYMPLLIVCEIASNRWRSWLMILVMSPRLVSMVYTVPLANTVSNAETFIFIACIIELLLIFVIRITPESPQWLLYNRKIHVAEKTLLTAAKRNGLKFSGEFKIRPVNFRAYNTLDETVTCLGVLTTTNIRVMILMVMIFWSLFYFLWGSLYLLVYTKYYTNNMMFEIFCFLCLSGCLTFLLSQKLKLKFLLQINVVLIGCFAFGAIIFQQETVRCLFGSIALALGVTIHGLMLIITPRLFAINVRATLFGCCHASGQLGAILSYLVFLFHAMNDITYLAVGIGISLIMTALCFAFPDVDGRELPDVMEDMDYFSELSKPLRWATQKTTSPSREEVIIKVYSFGSASKPRTSQSDERAPPQPIGMLRCWRATKEWLRNKCSCNKK